MSFPDHGRFGDVLVAGRQLPPLRAGAAEPRRLGLTLKAGDTTVTLENFVVNPGSSKLYGDVLVNGQVAASNAYLFSLHGGTLKPLQLEGDNAILTGTTVHVSDDAAKLLNSTFKTDAVKGGLLVGTATITAPHRSSNTGRARPRGHDPHQHHNEKAPPPTTGTASSARSPL